MKAASILIASYVHPHSLKWNLESQARQNLPFDFETILLNDRFPEESEQMSRDYKERLRLQYVFTGQRNKRGASVYRVPGFAINIGARLAQGEVIVISGDGLYHLNDTIQRLVEPVLYDPKIITTGTIIEDDGSFVGCLKRGGKGFNWQAYCSKCNTMNNRRPFLMAINRREFANIGGYDEDFIGYGFDDSDLMDRLLFNGCSLYLTQALGVNLKQQSDADINLESPEYKHNAALYRQRKGRVLRNETREWGSMQVSEVDSIVERRRRLIGLGCNKS